MLKNPNRQKVHLNVLFPSEKDTIALAAAVQERFVELLNQWIKPPPFGRGEPLVPPPELNQDVLLWRELCIRHKKGDYRNTADELKATQRIANWTLKRKRELVGKEYAPVEWQD